MSDSNRKRVSVVEETTFGETPATPTMMVIGTTGQSMQPNIGYQQSQTIRNDANIQDLVRLSKSSGGGVPTELVYPLLLEGEFVMIEAAMRASAGVAIVSLTTCAIASGGTTVTRATGSFVTEGFAVGDIVKVASTTNPLDTRFGKVTAVVTLTLTLQLGDGDTWATSDADVVVFRGERITNGTTDRSWTVEVASLDAEIFQAFTGQVVDGMELNITDGAITTLNFTYTGSSNENGTITAGVGITGATYDDPTINPVFDCIGVPVILLGGVSYSFKSMSLQISNNCAARTQVGSLGPQSIRRGSFSVTGRMTAYFDSFVEMNAFSNNTPSDLWLVMTDSNNQSVCISLPQFKWSSVSAPTRGLNQDDYLEMSFQAIVDPVEAATMKVFTFLV